MGKNSDTFISPNVLFYLIETIECGEDRVNRVVHSMVPTTWLSIDLTNVLYPPPSKKSSENPVNWSKSVYRRKVYPECTWMEYNVQRIINYGDEREHFGCQFMLKWDAL